MDPRRMEKFKIYQCGGRRLYEVVGSRLTGCFILLFLLLPAVRSSASEPDKLGITLGAGISIPFFDFGQLTIYDPNYPHDEYHIRRANNGWNLSVGTWLYFNRIDLGTKWKAGIELSIISISHLTSRWNFSVRRFVSGTNLNIDHQGSATVSYLFLSAEAGPFLSYSVSEKTAMYLSVKVVPTACFMGASYGVPVANYEKESLNGSGYGMLYAPSFCLKISKLILAFEYNTGSNFVSYHFTGRQPEKNSSYLLINGKTAGEYQHSTMPSTFLKISVGLIF